MSVNQDEFDQVVIRQLWRVDDAARDERKRCVEIVAKRMAQASDLSDVGDKPWTPRLVTHYLRALRDDLLNEIENP